MGIKFDEKPSSIEIQKELNRVKKNSEYSKTLKSTIYILLIVASIAVLVSVLYLPVLVVQGESMYPTLSNGDVLVSFKNNNIKRGDIVAFNYNNKVLLKRVIATQGEIVNIDEDGHVYVNGEILEEGYINKSSIGDITIDLPHQVQDDKVFVMGDYRDTSIDSREKSIGDVEKDKVIGKVLLRIWPLNNLGKVN